MVVNYSIGGRRLQAVVWRGVPDTVLSNETSEHESPVLDHLTNEFLVPGSWLRSIASS
jgi:hypothetical protein